MNEDQRSELETIKRLLNEETWRRQRLEADEDSQELAEALARRAADQAHWMGARIPYKAPNLNPPDFQQELLKEAREEIQRLRALLMKTTQDQVEIIQQSDKPQIEDIGNFWIIYIPVPQDEMGWKVKAVLWRKGDNSEFTHAFGKTPESVRVSVLRGIKLNGDEESEEL